jgi:hypothetical protein
MSELYINIINLMLDWMYYLVIFKVSNYIKITLNYEAIKKILKNQNKHNYIHKRNFIHFCMQIILIIIKFNINTLLISKSNKYSYRFGQLISILRQYVIPTYFRLY